MREEVDRSSPGYFAGRTGAPARVAAVDFAGLDRRGNEASFELIERVAAQLEGGAVDVHVVLTGAFGTGKTVLATHLLARSYAFWRERRNDRGRIPRFFRASEVGGLRFSSYSEAPEDAAERLRDRDALLETSPVVVIDDVGRTSGYRGEALFLESVVERRYDAMLGTILTMNELPDPASRFSDFLRYFTPIDLKGRSRRG